MVRNHFARMVFGVTNSLSGLHGTVRKNAKNNEFNIKFYEAVLLKFFVDGFVGGERDVTRNK